MSVEVQIEQMSDEPSNERRSRQEHAELNVFLDLNPFLFAGFVVGVCPHDCSIRCNSKFLGSSILRHCRLLLGRAVNSSQSPNEIAAIDADHIALRKEIC